MHGGNWVARSLILICLASSGCSVLPYWVPFAAETPDRLPGVLAPHEKIAALKKLAKEASTRSADEQQQVVRDLLDSLPAEKDPMIRAEILTTLAVYPGAAVDSTLQKAMLDPDHDVQMATCRAWAKRGGPAAVQALSTALRSSDDINVRLAAVRALGELHDPTAVAALGMALEDQDPALQYLAVTSLEKSTGKNLGNDVNAWRQYVKGETPQPRHPTSLAERVRHPF